MRPAVLLASLLLLFGLSATPASAAPAPIGGGSALFTGNYRCTVAFVAQSAGTTHLVAGPGCAPPPAQMLSGANIPVGPVTAAGAFGVWSLVAITNTAAWTPVPWITLGGTRHQIRGTAETPVGGAVCLLDQTSGVRCGTVLAKNQTVVFAEGAVHGLTKTNICMSPRSAIAFVSGDQAQGVPAGGSQCSTSGVSYFTPLRSILSGRHLSTLPG